MTDGIVFASTPEPETVGYRVIRPVFLWAVVREGRRGEISFEMNYDYALMSANMKNAGLDALPERLKERAGAERYFVALIQASEVQRL